MLDVRRSMLDARCSSFVVLEMPFGSRRLGAVERPDDHFSTVKADGLIRCGADGLS
jgi:hypothetical protein